MTGLDSPLKRGAAVVLVVGVVVLAVMLATAGYTARVHLFRWEIGRFLADSPRFYLPLALIVAGLAGSWLYDAGPGRVVQWVRGQSRPDGPRASE